MEITTYHPKNFKVKIKEVYNFFSYRKIFQKWQHRSGADHGLGRSCFSSALRPQGQHFCSPHSP
jgi:hypothetical protein